jgi:hypothetical protein
MAKKKQFQKPIELSEEEIFVDTESELAKEEFEHCIKLAGKEQQIFNNPNWDIERKTNILHHREYLCKRYKLDPNMNIGINSKTLEVFNFDFSNRGTLTLPEYLEAIAQDWNHFCNYDVIIEGDKKQLKQYILQY